VKILSLAYQLWASLVINFLRKCKIDGNFTINLIKMPRKAQKQQKRAKLAAQKQRRIMACRMVFENEYLVAKIMVEMRKLKHVGPLDLVRFSALNKKARRALIYLLPKRVWWTSTIRNVNNALQGNNSWTNRIGIKVLFLRFTNDLIADLSLLTYEPTWKDLDHSIFKDYQEVYRLYLAEKGLNDRWSITRITHPKDCLSANTADNRKRMNLRWKNQW
jgi:hypothetical protein